MSDAFTDCYKEEILKNRKDYYEPKNFCGVCGKEIFSYELCKECAKGNDCFDLDPDEHEYPDRSEI